MCHLTEKEAEREARASGEWDNATVITSTGRYGFSPRDLLDFGRVANLIKDEPALKAAGISENALREALSRVRPGATFRVEVEGLRAPEQPPPAAEPEEEAPLFSDADLAPVEP